MRTASRSRPATLDGATGLAIERHIYTAFAGDYYALPED